MKETVLIIDDTPANLQVLVRFLADSGYRTLIAEDGISALEQLARVKPDLILLDVTMPEMDGFETCRKLKASPELKEIPVLFLTARSDISDKLMGFNAGGQDYITKPIQKEEVIARVNAHLTILRQKRQLEAIIEQRQKFMRLAAHDLRNMLSIVSGYSELGQMCSDSSEKQNALAQISKAGDNMKAIIDDFLALNLLHRDKKGLTEKFDLGALVTQVMEQSAVTAQSKSITLSQDLPQPPLMASGNLAHTHQILSNYTSNALKYSPPKTQVRVGVRLNAGRCRVEIKDEGPGIAQHERDRLFLEFAKISNKPTGGETSTGLGLSIVRMLAHAQGGTVGAEFPEAGGSVFWLELLAA
jgi:signal transduction histidine kinase